jgi:hypothetical protein
MTCSPHEGNTELVGMKKHSNCVVSDVSCARENGGKKHIQDEDLVQSDKSVYCSLFEIERYISKLCDSNE